MSKKGKGSPVVNFENIIAHVGQRNASIVTASSSNSSSTKDANEVTQEHQRYQPQTINAAPTENGWNQFQAMRAYPLYNVMHRGCLL
jgi:hypothetical protein